MLLILAGCTSPVPDVTEPTILPLAEPTMATETEMAAAVLPVAVEYNLGETTITQARFPEDSRFRNMPVRLNGIIAAPTGGDGPYPVVLIIHGTHPGCPEIEGSIDPWPCDPEVEQPNYRGFTYLAEALAAEGYVAFAPNFNAENTFGFGEGTPGERLSQLLELHMGALAEAASGGPNDFGVELDGQADMSRMVFFGHSRGGEAAHWLTNSQGLALRRRSRDVWLWAGFRAATAGSRAHLHPTSRFSRAAGRDSASL